MNFDKKNIKIIIMILFSAILFYMCLKNLSVITGVVGYILKISSPFIIGAIIAFVINVPMRFIEKTLFSSSKKLAKIARPISYLITLVLVFGLITLISYMIIPQLAATMVILASQIPSALTAAQEFLKSNFHYFSFLNGITDNFDWQSVATKAATILQNAATSILNSGVQTISGIIGGILTFIIGFIFSIYLLMQKENLGKQIKQTLYALLPLKIADKTISILSFTSQVFSRFISGQCLEAIIIGVLFFISMSIFGMPYAILISVLIAFTALIPMVGSIIGCIVGVLLILMTSPFMALMFIIMYLVIQQIEGNLIYPYVVGNSVGLPSIWVLVAATIGAQVDGVFGILLFIPLSSVLYSLFRIYVKDRLILKGVTSEKWLKTIDEDSNTKKSLKRESLKIGKILKK